MLERVNKNYWPFFVAILLFLVILISAFSLYRNWDKPVDTELSVEVTLPIIDLGGYYNLSKQLGDGSFEE